MKIIKRIICLKISCLLVVQQSLIAGGLTVDKTAPTSNQANLESAKNGVPIVNIVAPNQKGLSHNKFSDYNVNKEGLILNNSNKSATNTQLAGYIYGNQNLKNGTAKTILNEVTSKNKSELKGFTEVAGDRANVVVANPNGIYINGAGFINTSRATITTGNPNIKNGEIDSFDVRQGQIDIDGEGLNLSNVNKAELYAQTVKLNAKIHSQDLDVVTGQNSISKDGTITNIENSVDEKPTLSIDSSALGGIYANKISLVGTQKGVGVNLPIEISAQDDFKLSADGKIVLDKVISEKNIDIKSNSSEVTSNVIYGNNINIEADNLLLGNSYIKAKNNLNLTINENLTLDKSNILQTENSLFLNTKDLTNHGFINSLYSMNIKANKISNYGGIASTNTENNNSNMTIEADDFRNYNTIYSDNNINLYIKDNLLNETNKDYVSGLDYARIYAKDNINLAKDANNGYIDNITNKSAIIETQNGDINIWADTFTNRRILDYANEAFVTTSKVTDSIYFEEGKSYPNKGSNGIINNFFITRGQDINLYANDSEFSLLIDLAREPYSYHYATVEVTMDKKIQYDNPLYKASQINSGKNLNLNIKNINNQISTISAVNDINLNTDTITNYYGSTYTTNISFRTYHEKGGKESKQDGVLRQGNKVLKASGDVWGDYNYGTYVANQNIGMGGTIVLGGNINGIAKNLINGTVLDNQTIFPTIDETKPAEVLNSIEVPTNQFGLFTKSTNPKANYLIESNPIYTDKSTFIGSSYFLEKMDYRGDRITKRLGDAAYETKLIRDEIIKQTGQRFINSFDASTPITSDYEQYKALMDNAINVSGDLKLEIGVAPTPEQLALLNKDIVWMEEKVVDGQTVLVPVLYLAGNYTKTSEAIINAKDEINLQISDKFVNSGEIKAGENLTIETNELINNRGSIVSDGLINITALNDIKNSSGMILADSILLQSTDGNVINETYSKIKGYKTVYTNIGKTGTIEATNGNLIIQGKNDITNIGADLVAKDNVLLQTQNGDINLNAIKVEYAYNEKLSGGFEKAQDINYQVSNVNANNIIMQSGKDINLEASKLNADNQINLNAKNDVNIEALNNLHYTDKKSTSKGFLSKTTQRDMVYKESVNSAELNANDILINANNDVNLQAAKLKAQDNIIVNAKDGNLNIVAKEYREGELHEKSKSSWGGLKKSLDISSTDALKLNNALLKTEASNVVLTSGKDINILASEINSGADIQLKALNDVLIASQSEYLKTQEVHKKSSFNLARLTSLVVPVDTTIYSSEIHKNDKLSSSSVASKLNANKDILIDSGSTTIVGSNLEANNIGIKADIGEINILSSQDVQNATSLDKEIKLGLSDPIKGIVQNTKNMFSGETKIKFEVGSLTYDEVDKASQTTKNNSSNLKAKENLVLDSLTDINVQGSNLKAGENLVLNSKVGDINILNTTDIYNEDIKEKHAKASVNVTVQNEYVETAQAVKSAVKSAEQLKQTKDDYSKYKGEVKKLENTLSDLKQRYKAKEVGIDYSDIEDLSDFIDNLKSQEKYYVAAIAAATADLASKTAAVATQAAAAASSSGTWGFSAGISLDVNGEKSKQNINNQTSNASNLNGKNIYINTDEKLSTNTNVVGSNVIADENLYINTNNLNVKASQDSSSSTQDSESINGSIAFTMYGGGGGTAGLGYGKSNSSSDSFLNNNSQLSGNNVNINVKNDAVFQGANVRANDTLNLNVGNNLVLESLRDEYSSNSKGFNVNAGIGFGSAGKEGHRTPSLDVGKQSSTNAGFSVNNGVTQNKQTVLSSITGDKVNVNVGNNTHLKGSLLASGNYDENGVFQDNKNLNFITNTLTFGNLSNSNYSSSKSLGANVNYNLEDKKIENQKEKPQQKGVSSVGYNSSNSLSVNASKTLATLGTGNVTVKDVENSDELDRLNRDTTAVNKDLYSSSTGTKVDATLDTRLLTEEGRKQIAEDIERTKRLGQAIGDVASSDSLNISDTFDHIGDVQKDLDVQKALALNDKGQTINILENQQNYSQEQIDKALNDYAQIYASVYGINIENAKIAVLNGKYGSTYTNKDNTNSNIYLDKGNNQNALDTANTLGHEVAHVRQNQGQTYLRDTLQLQEEYANLFGNYSSSGLDFSSYVYNNVKLDSNKINSLNSINDLYALYQNSVAYKKDVAKVNSGDGKIDDSIFVEKIEDNKYKVIDGKVDGKKEVYDEKGNVIAKTITQYSGFNEENKPVIGAIIDFSDKSGKEFLNTLTDSWTNPVLYFQDARNGGTNDFKTNGTVKGDENYGSGVYHNRFMIIDGTIFVNNNSLTPTIATGRDIGNIGAGYVAGSNFLSWSSIRIGFDGYNFIKNGQLTESPVSKEAQIKGFILGNPVYRNIINLSNELKND
ncbi:hemagglutinin repeat-containing protein [Aliarcobacter butzleri]|uniref:two-partner secretion domain-containing protein n=1 Tax=Aliarcobacter butzleri TaxID=28197 RepID=UPI003AF8DC16